jgi:CRISPR-associated protein Csm2
MASLLYLKNQLNRIKVIKIGEKIMPDIKTIPPVSTLFSEDAENFANKLNVSAKSKNENTATQIRRFYDELITWYDRIGDDEAKFTLYIAFIKMLNAKAAYAKGRKLVNDEFVFWFKDCISQVDSPATLRNFRLHFEAVLGFLKGIRG